MVDILKDVVNALYKTSAALMAIAEKVSIGNQPQPQPQPPPQPHIYHY